MSDPPFSPFAVDSWNGSAWTQIATDSTVGRKKLIRLASPVSTSAVRLRIPSSRAAPAVAELGLYRRPNGGSGNVTMVGAASGRCAGIAGASTANGTKLIIWDCHGGQNQQWSLRD